MHNAQCRTKDQVVGSDLETNGAKEAKEVIIIIYVPVVMFFLFVTMIVTILGSDVYFAFLVLIMSWH